MYEEPETGFLNSAYPSSIATGLVERGYAFFMPGLALEKRD
jgi:hypothetical protein